MKNSAAAHSSTLIMDRRSSIFLSNPHSGKRTETPLKTWAICSFLAAIVIGLIGLTGWLANVPILAQGLPSSVLIPPRTALLLIFTGLSIFLYAQRPASKARRLIVAWAGALAFFFSLNNEFQSPITLPAIEEVLLRNLNVWEYLYRDRMSPVDAQTFFVIGLMLLLAAFSKSSRRRIGDIVGFMALGILLVHGVWLLSYFYGSPLVYPRGFMPSSFLSGIGFLSMGLGTVSLMGPRHFPLRYLSGDSVRPQLMRTFLPIGLASILIYSLLLETVFNSLNPAITSSLSAFLATLMVGLLVVRSSQLVSHKIERAVRRSEEQFGVLVESLKDHAIFMLDLHGYVITWNEGAERFMGYRTEEILGEDVLVFYMPLDREEGVPPEGLRRALESGSYEEEGWRVRKNGSTFWAESVLTTVLDDGGHPLGFSVLLRDVSERKKNLENLRQKNTFIQLLQLASSAANQSRSLRDAMTVCLDLVCRYTEWPLGHGLVLNEEDVLISANWHFDQKDILLQEFSRDTDAKVFPIGYGLPGRVLQSGKPSWITQLIKDNAFIRQQAAAKAGIQSGCAFPVLSGTKVVGVIELFSQKIVEPNTELLELMVHIGTQLGRVAEREAAQARIRSSLEEKDVLLKEIHHRVKNNLQIISSLLRLQAERVQDPSTLSMLKESQDRVQSMAMIHENLYQSPDLAQVHFSDYISSLVGGLIRSYGVSPEAVHISKQVDPVRLNLDIAIPCGLIITELVSNALKHAFPEKRENPGQLVVGFHEENPNSYTLWVKDDGIGLPKDFQMDQATSLGLRLVRALANQLGGVMHVHRAVGTEFRITFNES